MCEEYFLTYFQHNFYVCRPVQVDAINDAAVELCSTGSTGPGNGKTRFRTL